MFSLHLSEPEQPDRKPPTFAERLRGKLIGFAAGLVLIAGIDAAFLHHVLWQNVSQSFAVNQPTIEHAIRSLWASLSAK